MLLPLFFWMAEGDASANGRGHAGGAERGQAGCFTRSQRRERRGAEHCELSTTNFANGKRETAHGERQTANGKR